MQFKREKSNLTDMTSGSPTKHILIFAAPLFIGNIFQQLYNMVDSVVVGNFVGANAIAAVGTCGSMNFFCFSLTSGLAIGIGIIVSQFFGAKDDKMVRATISNAIFVLAASSFIVGIFGFLICPFALKLLKCPESVFPDAVIYMKTTCCGIIFVAFYNGVASVLRALGDSKSPLYFLILSSVSNLILDLFFVLILKWGVFGVAFATIISQAIAAFSSMFYAYKKVSYFKITKDEFKPNKRIILNSLKIGAPIALQNSLISVSMMVLQGIVNAFGETIMAAYTIVMRVEQLVQQPYSSIGAAITNYSGQNIGAGKINRVKQGMRRGTIIVSIMSLVIFPIFWFFGGNIIGFFVKNEPQVISVGASALKITSLCYFMLGMIYVPRSVLNGCGDSKFAMINGVTEIACRIGLAPLLTRIPSVGFWGIWLTTVFTWTITALVCFIRYKSGIWKKKSLTGKK